MLCCLYPVATNPVIPAHLCTVWCTFVPSYMTSVRSQVTWPGKTSLRPRWSSQLVISFSQSRKWRRPGCWSTSAASWNLSLPVALSQVVRDGIDWKLASVQYISGANQKLFLLVSQVDPQILSVISHKSSHKSGIKLFLQDCVNTYDH